MWRAALETAGSLFKQREQRVDVELPKAPAPVLGDADRLCQVCVNLLNNASKYSPRGGALSIALRVEAAEARIVVRDQGDGIAPDMLPRIFEPFFQAPDARVRSEGGMGVGLSVARGVVEQHQGSIEALSQGPGRGSQFTVRLPLDSRATAAVEPASVGIRRDLRKIVIVEDQPDSLAMLVSLLDRDGLEVVAAENGEEGLRRILAERPGTSSVYAAVARGVERRWKG